MAKIQNILRLFKSEMAFFILILIVVVGLFAVLSPKISASLFPFKREIILSEFINSTRNNGAIDPQEYWKFREFYSPGHFTFSRNGVERDLILKTEEKIGVQYDNRNIVLTFLHFLSPQVESLDMLTNETSLNMIIDQNKIPTGSIIFSRNNCLVYEESPGIIKIVFLLSNSDMKKANGFFDYNDKDREITQNKNWFNTTTIKR